MEKGKRKGKRKGKGKNFWMPFKIRWLGRDNMKVFQKKESGAGERPVML